MLPVGIALFCCGAPFFGAAAWFQPDARRDLTNTFAGRMLLTILGGALLVAMAVFGVAVGRVLVVRWVSRLYGTPTTARVVARSNSVDAEGDDHWTVRVEGVAPDGTAFAEEIGLGSRVPEEIGAIVPVRYHRRAGVTLIRRTVGAVIEAVIMDILIAGLSASGLAIAIGLGYGIVAMWVTAVFA
jgi:hypothetical protein